MNTVDSLLSRICENTTTIVSIISLQVIIQIKLKKKVIWFLSWLNNTIQCYNSDVKTCFIIPMVFNAVSSVVVSICDIKKSSSTLKYNEMTHSCTAYHLTNNMYCRKVWVKTMI